MGELYFSSLLQLLDLSPMVWTRRTSCARHDVLFFATNGYHYHSCTIRIYTSSLISHNASHLNFIEASIITAFFCRHDRRVRTPYSALAVFHYAAEVFALYTGHVFSDCGFSMVCVTSDHEPCPVLVEWHLCQIPFRSHWSVYGHHLLWDPQL